MLVKFEYNKKTDKTDILVYSDSDKIIDKLELNGQISDEHRARLMPTLIKKYEGKLTNN